MKPFFRENPQVLVLLVVCLVLGIGTFLAVIFGLLSAGNQPVTGEPSGAVLPLLTHAVPREFAALGLLGA